MPRPARPLSWPLLLVLLACAPRRVQEPPAAQEESPVTSRSPQGDVAPPAAEPGADAGPAPAPQALTEEDAGAPVAEAAADAGSAGMGAPGEAMDGGTRVAQSPADAGSARTSGGAPAAGAGRKATAPDAGTRAAAPAPDAGARSAPAPSGPPAPSGAAVAAPDKKTERLWKAKCASCHGMDGKAQTDKGKEMKVRDMTTPQYQKRLSDADLRKSMVEGINRTENGVKQEMDSYEDSLSPEQMDALGRYVRWVGAQR